MQRFDDSSSSNNPAQPPIALFNAKQIYAVEQAWFDAGNTRYGLMQQAAWLIASWVYAQGCPNKKQSAMQQPQGQRANQSPKLTVCIWVGGGNNGGDGWLTAAYLSQLGVAVTVIEVGEAHREGSQSENAKRAKKSALQQPITHIAFADILLMTVAQTDQHQANTLSLPVAKTRRVVEALLLADVFIDALFGIGLDRAPTGDYAKAILCFNDYAHSHTQAINNGSTKTVVAIDMPSGLVANTGQVFDGCAVKADVTLCLIARKLGLHLKDGNDYAGNIIDMPLVPTVFSQSPIAQLQKTASSMPLRAKNTHKGSFGHVLIVGGNQVAGSQGMGGAAILAASAAFAAGVGKVTVACHYACHSSLIARLPHAMSLDLHDREGVNTLINACEVMAIGMGLGRDASSQALCAAYIASAIAAGIAIVMDADALYHLAEWHAQAQQQYQDKLDVDDGDLDASIQAVSPSISHANKAGALIEALADHAEQHQVYYTPHSGEAAKLLGITAADVEADKMTAVTMLQSVFQGSWLLKGTGSIVIEQGEPGKQGATFVCAGGNAGMATAGMGDVLSGLAAGLLAQDALPIKARSLLQAVMIHAIAGDRLGQKLGQAALQACDMPNAIGQVLQDITA